MKPKKLTKDEVQATLKMAIDDAREYISAEIQPQQVKAQNYFDGKTTLPSVANRSKVVATKCRDTVRALKPGVIRLFMQSQSPVEFVPTRSDGAQEAEQKTQFANYVFERNNGFHTIHDAIHDAMIKKVGIVKVFYDESPTVEIDEYSGITEEMIAILEAEPDIEILEIEVEQEAEIGPDGMAISAPVYSVKVARKDVDGDIKIVSIAPEDFFIDKGASNIEDAYISGHSSEMRVGDLVNMGFDFETVYDVSGVLDDDEEQEYLRKGSSDDSEGGSTDKSMRPVLMTEAYMKMDIEGTGVPKMYKFICAGTKYKILEQELCDYNPFAVFEVDPEPHAFFGRSVVDLIEQDQDAATGLLRGLLDNIAMSNNPRVAANEQIVNIQDLMNNEIGGIIRTKGPLAGNIQEFSVGAQSAAAGLAAIQHYDGVIREKTGIVGAGMGLDVEALQSQTAAGVRLADQTTNAQSEFIARILAESGMKRLFKLIAMLARQHQGQTEMQVNGAFVPVDPRSWTLDAEMRVNVGLGTNKSEERMMTLNQIIQWQQGIWSAYGAENGLVTMTGIRAAMADFAKIGGVHGIDKYINPMDYDTEQALLMKTRQKAEQSQGQASDPNAAFLQAEQMKVSARVQADQQKTQLDYQKAVMQDDRERDKMAQDLFLEAAKMASAPAPVNQIQQVQNAPRNG